MTGTGIWKSHLGYGRESENAELNIKEQNGNEQLGGNIAKMNKLTEWRFTSYQTLLIKYGWEEGHRGRVNNTIHPWTNYSADSFDIVETWFTSDFLFEIPLAFIPWFLGACRGERNPTSNC